MTNLETWNEYLCDIESSQNYIDWCWYSTVSSALERRVWLTANRPEDNRAIFLNQFLLLVGDPSCGKGRAMRSSEGLLNCVEIDGKKVFKAGPTSGSMQGIIKKLSEAEKHFKRPCGDLYSYYAMMIHSEELSVLCKKEDRDTPPAFQSLYDSLNFDKGLVKEEDSIDLKHVCVNLISATQPDHIKNSFSTSLFGQGFMSRFIIVYADGPRFFRDTVEILPSQDAAKLVLLEHLKKLSKLYGKVTFTPEAIEFRKSIIESEQNYYRDRPNLSAYLKHYYGRKRLHWFKLSCAMHFSDSLELVVDRPVMEKAYRFLAHTEKDMHRAFDKISANPHHEVAENLLSMLRLSGAKGIPKSKLRLISGKDMDGRVFKDTIEMWVESGQVRLEGGANGVIVYAK